MSLTLVPMDEVEFDAYLERLSPEYAREGAKATGMASDDALTFAGEQIRTLLPEGLATPGHHFRNLVAVGGETVGVLWFAERPGETPPDLFIYDIHVTETKRGKGFGTSAIRRLGEESPGLGAAAISLHVFETIQPAIRLYERLGYECTHRGQGGRQMSLRL